MKNEIKKVPTIRFKGFIDDWEQRKFSELFKRRMERNNGQFDKTKWISVANMYYQDPDKVTSNNIDTRTYVLRLGDISFEGHSNKEFKIGRFVENDIGDGVISELFPIYQHITSYDLNFWKHYINIENIMFPKLQRCIEVSYTSSNKLSEKFFLKESILVPAILEQKKIGIYLKKINNLITLHQRKLKQLQTLKKYFLQNMFPAKEEKVPAIRFKGFTDDWEQRKLGELVEFNPSEELPDEFEYVDLESVVGTEMITHRHENKATAPSRAQRVARQGDLFYQTVRPYQKNNYLFDKPDNDYVFSTGYAQMRPYIDGHFLLDLVQTERFVKVVLDNCTGTSYPAINANDLASIKITYPQCRSEQQTIGIFLASIDTLITLHQRKCDQLQSFKKFMLQNLFI